MRPALVIINGLGFPYFLADHAIAWAKQEGGELLALFLSSGKEVPEGYGIPSDIDLAETLTNKQDTEKSSLKIIQDQMDLFADMAKTAGVTCNVELLTDPKLEQVLEKTDQATILFAVPGYGDTAQLAITRFSIQDLIDQARCPVETVSGKD
jgi:hypothetical protein